MKKAPNKSHSKLRLKKGDLVMLRAGADKGKTGKVLSVLAGQNAVLVEGIGLRKRHIRPSQAQPRGGVKDVHLPVPAGKVSLLYKDKPTRIGYVLKKDNTKVRVARAANNKEIK